MGKLRTRSVTFHYEDQGQGKPLLCIPGMFGTGNGDFGPQLSGLAEEFRVIAPDPRGYGRSRPPRRDFPKDFLQRDAEDMVAIMSELGFSSFAIAGWSDGANAGVLAALTYPERVERLIIWGGNAYLSSEDMAALEKIRSLSSWSPRALEAMEKAYGDSFPALWEEYNKTMQAIYRDGGGLYKSSLKNIRCPTLILHGALDPIVPGFQPLEFERRVPNACLYFFPSGKHNIHLRFAEVFNQVVSRFLRAPLATQP